MLLKTYTKYKIQKTNQTYINTDTKNKYKINNNENNSNNSTKNSIKNTSC